MMAAQIIENMHLIDRLPKVRGRISADSPLAQVTWFRVGGPAEVMFRPADLDDLASFMAAIAEMPEKPPLTVIGVASNLLVRDGGVDGVVVRLGGAFATIQVEGDKLVCGAAALDGNIALAAREASLSGLEFLSGIPGTLGGALRMNAGAYGREIADVLVEAEGIDAKGNKLSFSKADMNLSYRHCGLPEDIIFTKVMLRASPGDKATIQAEMQRIKESRETSQPVRSRTGGSTFANPDPEESNGLKAWQLIDQAGCRGLQLGGAMVSEQHCNFLINTGNATAADLEGLGEEVRRRVKASSGVTLRWEIRRIGTSYQGDAL